MAVYNGWYLLYSKNYNNHWFFLQVSWFSIDGEPFEAKTITISLLPQKLHFFFTPENILWQVIKYEGFKLTYFVTIPKRTNPTALPNPSFYWSLWPVPCWRYWGLGCIFIVLFSITDLERYRVCLIQAKLSRNNNLLLSTIKRLCHSH